MKMKQMIVNRDSFPGERVGDVRFLEGIDVNDTFLPCFSITGSIVEVDESTVTEELSFPEGTKTIFDSKFRPKKIEVLS